MYHVLVVVVVVVIVVVVVVLLTAEQPRASTSRAGRASEPAGVFLPAPFVFESCAGWGSLRALRTIAKAPAAQTLERCAGMS